jgi:hypothetical protein
MLYAVTATGGGIPDIFWIAIIAVFSAVLAPLILSRSNIHQQRLARKEEFEQRKAEKAEDYRRQDEVAAQAAQAARDLLGAQQEMQRRTDEVARLAAENADRADTKLNQIHTLVNSDMTAARQSELDQTRAMLVVLKRVTALAALRGEHADPEDLDAIARTEKRISSLEAILADRMVQLREVEAAAASVHSGPPLPDGTYE